jgi:hypothetical protein
MRVETGRSWCFTLVAYDSVASALGCARHGPQREWRKSFFVQGTGAGRALQFSSETCRLSYAPCSNSGTDHSISGPQGCHCKAPLTIAAIPLQFLAHPIQKGPCHLSSGFLTPQSSSYLNKACTSEHILSSLDMPCHYTV